MGSDSSAAAIAADAAEDGRDPARDEEEQRGERRARDEPDVEEERGGRVAVAEKLGLDGLRPHGAARGEQRRGADADRTTEDDEEPRGPALMGDHVERNEGRAVADERAGSHVRAPRRSTRRPRNGADTPAMSENAATANPPSR